jgi:hypothetical protein
MERRPGPLFVLALMAFRPESVLACAYCRPAVQAQVYNARFLPHLSMLILPVVLLGLIAALIHFWDKAVSLARTLKGTSV